MKTFEEFDDYLTAEIRDFDNAAKFGQSKGLVRYGTYAIGCRDLAEMARAVFRASFLPDRVEPGDIIKAVVAKKNTEKQSKTT